MFSTCEKQYIIFNILKNNEIYNNFKYFIKLMT
jgi:hypothetical protein